jgi:hypothetical protein
MTEAEATQLILARWEDEWDILHPPDGGDPAYVPYTYTSEGFATDALGDLGSWVRLTIRHTTSKQLTQGSAPYRKWERRGLILVQLFAPIDQGVGALATLAGDVRTCLEGYRAEDLNLYEATTADEREDGVWAMKTLSIRFRYVETR